MLTGQLLHRFVSCIYTVLYIWADLGLHGGVRFAAVTESLCNFCRAQGGKKRKLAPAHGNGFDTVPTSMLLKGAAGAGFQVPQLRKLASAN